jgi:hypothetical protein
MPLPAALACCAAFRASGVGAEWWLSLTEHTGPSAVIAVTCIEHFAGGALTTVLFTLMMRRTDRDIGGTHYTLLASLEVWGKLPLAALSGVIAATLGYPALFAIGSALCVAFSLFLFGIRTRLVA